jgi:hypothetical protein
MNSENYDYKRIELKHDKHSLFQVFNVRIIDFNLSKWIKKTIFYLLITISITYFTQVNLFLKISFKLFF